MKNRLQTVTGLALVLALAGCANGLVKSMDSLMVLYNMGMPEHVIKPGQEKDYVSQITPLYEGEEES